MTTYKNNKQQTVFVVFLVMPDWSKRLDSVWNDRAQVWRYVNKLLEHGLKPIVQETNLI